MSERIINLSRKEMKRAISIFLIVLLGSIELGAQPGFFSVDELADCFYPMTVPNDFFWDRRPERKSQYGMISLKENSKIPLALYTNFQCTESFASSFDADDLTAPCAVGMMLVPDSDLKLFSVWIGGMTEYGKMVILLVDSDGNILDVLESMVVWGPIRPMFAKESRIDANFNITVYSIHTSTVTSLPIDDSIPSFYGWREDDTYRVINRKFVRTNKIRYQTRRYNYIHLTTNIWEGFDIPFDREFGPLR